MHQCPFNLEASAISSACLRSSFAFSFEREATAPRQPFARSGPTRKPNAKIAQIADLAFSERNTSGINETTERPQGMLEQSRGSTSGSPLRGCPGGTTSEASDHSDRALTCSPRIARYSGKRNRRRPHGPLPFLKPPPPHVFALIGTFRFTA